jgi:hypothetical protein
MMEKRRQENPTPQEKQNKTKQFTRGFIGK